MPGKPPDPPISAQTVAGWHERRGRLLAMLHDDPEADWAWLWRVHVGIADYLIHRYAGEAGDGEAGAARDDAIDEVMRRVAGAGSAGSSLTPDFDADPETSPGRALRLPYDNARVERAASLEGPAAERLREQLRDRLSSLNQTNDERREHAPPILPTPPPKRAWYLPPLEPYPPLPEHLRPMPGWLERVLFVELAWPPRLSVAKPCTRTGQVPPVPPDGFVWVRWTTCPESMEGPPGDSAPPGIEQFDEASLALLQQAMRDDDAWDLSSDQPLSGEEIVRLLGGEDDSMA
ncbi:hypothetical protein OT109_05465 [Phycisphaeraceae bacterium D3-23]